MIYIFSQSEAEPHKFVLTSIGAQDIPELSLEIEKCQSVYKSRQCSILVVRQFVYCCVPAGIAVFDIQQHSS